MSPIFRFVTQRFKSFPSDLPRARWRNLTCVECLWMIKPMVVGFSFYWRLIRLWVWNLRTLAQFQGSEMSPGLFQDFMDGYIKP